MPINQQKRMQLLNEKLITPYIAAVFATLLSITINSQANAQDLSAKSSSNDVVITGNRGKKTVKITPKGAFTVLGKKDFESVNAVNTEDLVKYAPNIYVRKRYAGDDNSIVSIRGVNTIQPARTIVNVDGFLISNFLGNTYSFPPKWGVVSPNEVKQVDILYGPYSSHFGGNSMGGIISITTDKPTKDNGYLSIQSSVMPKYKQYGVNKNFSGYNIELGQNFVEKDGGPFSGSFSYRHFENEGQPMTYGSLTTTTGTGTAVTGAYSNPYLASGTTSQYIWGAAPSVNVNQDQFKAKINYNISDNWKAGLLGVYWQNEQNLDNAYSFLKDANGNTLNSGKVTINGKTYSLAALTDSLSERNEYLLGANLDGKVNGWEIRNNLSHYEITKNETKSSNDLVTANSNGAGKLAKDKNPNWWVLASSATKEFGNNKIAIGVDANQYATETNNYKTTNWRNGNINAFNGTTGGKTANNGIFLEDEIKLGEKTKLTLGTRYDSWRAFDGKIIAANGTLNTYDKRNEDAISPKITLDAEVAPNWKIQASAAKTTRFPTVGELYQGKIDTTTNAIDPQSYNPNLKPEKSNDLALMVKHNIGKVKTTTNFFYQDIDDAIISFTGLNQYGNLTTSYKNIDKSEVYGVEFSAEAKDVFINGLDFSGSVARQHSEVLRNIADTASVGKPLIRIHKWRANGNIKYRVNPKFDANLGIRYADRPYSDMDGTLKGDAYGLETEYLIVDTRFNYKIKDNVKFGFGIDNLNNDKAYVYHPLPQRTFIADLKYEW